MFKPPRVIAATFSDGTELTWDELKIAEGGTKYGYDASAITDDSIGTKAFSHCTSLTSINIPDGVTVIGEQAFFYCSSLTNVTIGNSVISIEKHAFCGCTSLTNITIPASVTSIGDYAFSNCTNLINATIGNGVKSIGTSAFWKCPNLANVTIGNSVTSIGGGAFDECTNLTSINIPSKVISIGGNAFRGCSSLTSINIPASTTNISYYAFYGCTSLATINVDVNNTAYKDIDGVLFTKNGTALQTYPAGKTDTSYTIPECVTSIGEYAFQDASKLTSIIIPDGVTQIVSATFLSCSSLTSITIPDGVTSIGSSAFNGCTSLTSIEMPNSTTSISYYAFGYCKSLTDITYNGTREQWNTINKTSSWDDSTGNYTIHCTDGDLCKTHTYGSTTVTQPPTCTETGAGYQTCSICGYVNDVVVPPQHNFVNGACSICGQSDGKTFDNAITANVGSYTATIAIDNYVHSNKKIAIYKFVAPETKTYIFKGTGTSSSPGDTYGYLFDSSKSQIASDDDSGGNRQFKISYICTAGETYYLGVAFLSSSKTGDIPFSISES